MKNVTLPYLSVSRDPHAYMGDIDENVFRKLTHRTVY